MESDFDRLLEIGKKASTLNSIHYLLQWDQETYMKPGSASIRSMQRELLASLTHAEKTSPEIERALSKLIDLQSGEILDDSLDNAKKSALREWRRDFNLNKKLPESFVKRKAKTISEATSIWAKAKKENNFPLFAPHLEKVIADAREEAKYLGYKDHPYDALLDQYEQGITSSDLTKLFSELKPFLVDLCKKCADNKISDESFLFGSFSDQKQYEFHQYMLTEMGLDPNYSRLDKTNHPFCIPIHPHDVRLTTHSHSSSLFESISAVLHEGGHALYELALNPENFGSPLCEATSLGIHESQSRFYETIIGQSLSLWKYFYPTLQKMFPEKLSAVPLETFYQTINTVKPSFIRIHADEVTYILHVILRFEIEMGLLNNEFEVSDIPNIWNQKMQDLLGIVPNTDSEGCLQDVHWSCGLIGYFPTYALGNLYAAQIFATFKKIYPDFEKKIADGNLTFIKEFLNENVHKFGREYTPADLIKKVTGKKLSTDDYIEYLSSKYSQI